MPCEIIGCSESDLKRAASFLSEGKLVALPTETVYGLGGNVWLPEAVKKIFLVKSRPSTDPLICHVDVLEKGLKLWAGGNKDEKNYSELMTSVALATFIGSAFWPGPLTIVCRASSLLPLEVTGGSGYVGIRIPNHPVALGLLRMVDFAVAAPSANTFGHVSPISASHVYDDLALRDPALLIIDGGKCNVGIESTVIKIEDNANCIKILRRGKITATDIREVLCKRADYELVPVVVRDTRSKKNAITDAPTTWTHASKTTGDLDKDQKHENKSTDTQLSKSNEWLNSGLPKLEQPMDGPGQLLTHYSPCIPASLLVPTSFIDHQKGSICSHAPSCLSIIREKGGNDAHQIGVPSAGIFPLSSTVVIDFYGLLLKAFGTLFLETESNTHKNKAKIPFIEVTNDNNTGELRSPCSFSLQTTSEASQSMEKPNLVSHCLAYIDLSVSGDIDEASSNVFEALRWSEKVPGSTNVVFPSLSSWLSPGLRKKSSGDHDADDPLCKVGDRSHWSEFLDAVDDRLFRAASGVVAFVK